ncbi:MAG TPA: HAD family hydrolase [Anaerohalosphaeraceae bacterium]|nr:HAD family hydrolase [Anaerohalosphaeraceae bacterium]HOL88150.1 HAD family hydrolase [Anaerohalosphaeraceae bacterium]HPP56010.1 HAD family hydrolase [Anaerohalosphaeraceae bacterium]
MDSDIRRILYVSDLDGTLLRNDGTLSDRSRRRLCELLEAGVNFTVASARTWSEIVPLLEGVPLRLPVIAVNGAFLSDFATGRALQVKAIEKNLAAAVYDEIRRTGLAPFICGYDGSSDKLYYQDLLNEQMRWFHGVLMEHSRARLCRIEPLEKALSLQVVSFAVMGEDRLVERLARRLEEQYGKRLECFHFQNPYSNGHWWLTIHDAAACKSKAVTELARMYGFAMDNVVVFGDHINDIQMFRTAGRAVAVANAHESLKSCADEIIASNEEDAVVDYISRTLSLIP